MVIIIKQLITISFHPSSMSIRLWKAAFPRVAIKRRCIAKMKKTWLDLVFGSREYCIYIFDIRIRGIYLSLTLGTAKLKQQD